MPKPGSEERIDKFPKGVGPMRKRVLGLRRHFAERLGIPVGNEHRIVAEAPVSARRPHQRSIDATFERLLMSIGPGNRERAYEMGTPLFKADRSRCLQL